MKDIHNGPRSWAQHHLKILQTANNLFVSTAATTSQALRIYDAEHRNFEVAQRWAKENMNENRVAAFYCAEYPLAGSALFDCRQNASEQLSWLEDALAASVLLRDPRRVSAALNSLGTCYIKLGKPRKAIVAYEQALQIDRQLRDQEGEAVVIGNLGVAYASTGEVEKAILYYDVHLELARELGDLAAEANALNNLGAAHSILGHVKEGLEKYQQTLVVLEKLNNVRAQARTLVNIGLQYGALDQWAQALACYKKALPLDRSCEDEQSVGITQNNMGIAYRHLGERTRAFYCFKSSLEIAQKHHNDHLEANALVNIGIHFKEHGEPDDARKYFEKARDIEERLGNTLGKAKALANLATLCDESEMELATSYNEEALAIHRDLGHRQDEAKLLSNLGAGYARQGDRARSRAYLELSLKLAVEMEDLGTQASALFNLGMADTWIGYWGTAAQFFLAALDICKRIQDKVTETLTLRALAYAYENLGKFHEARTCYEVLFQTARANNDSDVERELLLKISSISEKLRECENSNPLQQSDH